METDRKHKLEIAELKRQLKRAQRHTKTALAIARQRENVVCDMRDDLFHFCLGWLECLELFKGDWRSMALAKNLWFNHCQEALPNSEKELFDRLRQVRLFENGELPKIKTPDK